MFQIKKTDLTNNILYQFRLIFSISGRIHQISATETDVGFHSLLAL